MREIVAFFRQYPQVLVLLVICLVLGIGTFVVVIFGLFEAHSTTTTGEPSGAILHAVIATVGAARAAG